MIYMMNLNNKNTKKDLRLAYSQENYTAYLLNISATARYISTQYPNNKPASQRESNKENKRKVDDPRSEDKDNIIDSTAEAHVEDTTTSKDTTTPSGGANLGAHISELSQATPRPSHTVEEILGAHPIDDTLYENTNPADVSVDTMNSEEQMAEAILPNSTLTKANSL